MEDRTEQLRKIKDEIVEAKNSPLYDFRVKNNFLPVIGEGDHYAKIMFIGEAPGKNEALTGRPFCGAAGRILDELLQSINIERKDVYVTNIVKDRPPFNRDPLPEEIEFYAPFLMRQIEIIEPEIITTLGRFSMAYIMKKFEVDTELSARGGSAFGGKSISTIHGKTFTTKISYGEVKIIPLYHPAVAIYNNNTKETLKKDFEILKEFSKKII
ncbi:MAG: uracil-DNA glycosylase family protein [Patescibacteria group bacterium]